MSRVIWFVVEHDGETPHRAAPELAAAARSLDAEAVAVVCCGSDSKLAEAIAPHVDRVLCLQADALSDYSVDGWAQALVDAASSARPDAILLPHAPLGRDLGPALAARLNTGMLSDCVALEWEDGLVGSRSAYRRKLMSREKVLGAGPAIATVQRGAFPAAPPAEPAGIEVVEASVAATGIRVRELSRESSGAGEADIVSAKVVVAGGRGLGDAEKFQLVQQLADALGGAMGASRPVVDQGWVPHDRQIGSSGVTVRPKLYIGLGISGAIQHIVGMRESDVIVAVNKDAQAPIFEYAHYGIVGDLFDVVPVLLEELQA